MEMRQVQIPRDQRLSRKEMNALPSCECDECKATGQKATGLVPTSSPPGFVPAELCWDHNQQVLRLQWITGEVMLFELADHASVVDFMVPGPDTQQ